MAAEASAGVAAVREDKRPAPQDEDFCQRMCDRTERANCPEAASLWYKIIDARSQRSSTALVTNIDFESWAEYLGDAPLAMAMLDRVVDGATIVKLKGKSYRVHRGGDAPGEK